MLLWNKFETSQIKHHASIPKPYPHTPSTLHLYRGTNKSQLNKTRTTIAPIKKGIERPRQPENRRRAGCTFLGSASFFGVNEVRNEKEAAGGGATICILMKSGPLVTMARARGRGSRLGMGGRA